MPDTIDRPRPVPVSLVMKKGPKMRRRTSGGIPSPVSATWTTAPSPAGAVRRVSSAPLGHGVDRVQDQVDEHLAQLRPPRLNDGNRQEVGAHGDGRASRE